MIELDPERIAEEARATIVRRGGDGRPTRAVIDSREISPGDLFVGLPGEHADGGEFAENALRDRAWGVLVAPEHAEAIPEDLDGWVLTTPAPLPSLQRLARGWRRELGCKVVGITGSTGKTSAKDIAKTILPARVHASPENFNTEIGLPLTILSAPPETEVMVLEMGMRGLGQIAELCEIAEPDVAAITNIGPVHIELLGAIEGIAEAKAEILTGLGPTGRAVIPVDTDALQPHLHDELITFTFGPGGDIHLHSDQLGPGGIEASVATPHGEAEFSFPFDERYNLANALCAIAIGVALDLDVGEMARKAPGIVFSRLRGESIELGRGIVLINDCYNANPVSMRASLDHLATLGRSGDRRIAILGEMAELGPGAPGYHSEIGAHARELGIDVIVGVGEAARDYAPDVLCEDPRAAVDKVAGLLEGGDVVLLKASRSVGLEQLSEGLEQRFGGAKR